MQGPLKQMDGIATKCNFANGHDLGILKVLEIALPNLNDRSQESTEKSLVGIALPLSTFPPS